MFVCTEYIHTYFVKLNLRRKEKKDLPSVIPKHTTKIVHFNATDYIFFKKKFSFQIITAILSTPY